MTNVIANWNQAAVETVKALPGGHPRGDTGDVARTFGMLNVAMFDAVAGIPGVNVGKPMLIPGTAAGGAAPEAAVAGAAFTVLRDLFPEDAFQARLQAAFNASLATADPLGIAAGLERGMAVGQQLLEARREDAPATDNIGTPAPGSFARQWGERYGRMTPLGLESGDLAQFRADPPPPSNGSLYAQAWKDVRARGYRAAPASIRSADETAIARFWNGGTGTSRPTGAWFEIGIAVANEQGQDLQDSARMFALLGMAICNGMISSWDSKAVYDLWRPQSAIRRANEDGNPLTDLDVNWIALSNNEGGSPEYTSGTATFAGAGSTILIAFFGTDNISFSLDLQDVSNPNENTQRAYTSFSQAATEAGESRILNGIHFQFANEAGMKAGREVAKFILDKYASILGNSGPKSTGAEKGGSKKRKTRKKAKRG